MPARYLAKLEIKLRRLFNYFEVFFVLAQEILSNRNFIYLASVAVGISCALAVILLKTFAHKVFLFANYANGYLKLPYANSIFPIIGILLTVFVIRNFLDGSIEKGSSRILHAVAKKNGIMPRKQMYAQIITSSLKVGMGGSAGLESPITITGAAFGSNFAQKYKLSQKDRILLRRSAAPCSRRWRCGEAVAMALIQAALPRWPGWRNLPRDTRDTLFLLGVISWTVLPHLDHLPWWCIALSAVVLVWRAYLAVGHLRMPSRLPIAVLLGAAVVMTFWTEQTLFGKEAGVTMLVVLMSLKTLELRARRDALVVFFLGFFLVLTHFLYSQSMLTALAMLLSVWDGSQDGYL